MKQFIPLFLLFVATFTFSNAQIKYYPSQIVLANGENINAEVYFEDWINSPQSIKVKTDNKTIEYFAKDLKEFSIPELKLAYSTQYIKFNYITKKVANSLSEIVEETVEGYFLMNYLIRSEKLSLFQFVDAKDKIRFFLKKDEDTIELQSYEFMILVNDLTEKRINREYKNQLINTLLVERDFDITNLNYERKAMASFIGNYLSKNGIKYINYAENSKFKAMIKFGYSMGTAGLQNFSHGTPPSNLNLGFSVLNFLPNKNNNRFTSLELFFTPQLKTQTPQISKINQKAASVNFGQFIGKNKLQAVVSVGAYYTITTIRRDNFLDFKVKENSSTFNIAPGVGIAYDKTWILELVRPVVFLGGRGIQMDPQIRLKFLPHLKMID